MAQINSWGKALLLVKSALEKKALDLVVLEVRDLTSIADYFIVCSGRSDRQVQSVAQGVEETARKAGIRPISVEGLTRGHWVLMDFSDVIVHIFYEPVRAFYDLDGLWDHAPRAKLPEPYSTLASQFQITPKRVFQSSTDL
ncbi:MAG TPA: ribosome silencing factor [Terriglobales bacterium]|nr:ribosome silencing factor [Terriglobales bacterium]